AGLSLLLLRAWSIQVLHGKQYAKAAHTQAFRTVDLFGARGAIVDDRGRLIAGTTGHVVIDADAASLGSRNAHGIWSPSPAGLRALRRLARITDRRRGILAAQIPVDSMGRIAGPLRVPPQKQPPKLQLSIDTRLQKAAARALQYGIEQARLLGHNPPGASAVAIDPWTGAIKAIVSYPTFDQKRAADNPHYYSHVLNEEGSTPGLNRAITGVYPTGSTFKP